MSDPDDVDNPKEGLTPVESRLDKIKEALSTPKLTEEQIDKLKVEVDELEGDIRTATDRDHDHTSQHHHDHVKNMIDDDELEASELLRNRLKGSLGKPSG